jgi:hypothetical protein
MRFTPIFIAIITFSSAAVAQNVYKHSSPSGGVTYSDDPNPGTGTVTRVEIPSKPGDKPTLGLSDTEKKLSEQANRRAAELDRATEDIIAAFKALRAAEARREPGIEPIEGERSGRRFRPEYWERQQALKRDVDEAQARLDDALSRRNALR